jgi:hypothetical protein
LHIAENGEDASHQRDEWRQDLRHELLTNRSRLLTSRYPKLSDNITDDFPDLGVLWLYTHPASHSNNLAGLSFTHPDLGAAQLTKLAAVTFQWGRSAAGVFNRYRDHLFPAMALWQLVQAMVAIDHGNSEPGGTCCTILGEIVGERAISSTCFLPEFRVLLVIPSELIEDICASLPGPALNESTIAEIEQDCRDSRAWLPRVMVEVVRPDLASAYKGSASGRCRFIGILFYLLISHVP